MKTAPCPDESVLARFSTGGAQGAERSTLEEHLDHCPNCRQVVDKLTSADGGMGATLPRAAAGADWTPGAQLGRYRLERELGQGGMGIVFAGRDEQLGRAVALKLLRGGAQQTALRPRLLREAQAMARLSHPNVVPIFELGRAGDDDFLVMELIDGPTLDHWFASRGPTKREVLRMYLEAGRGLAAAHQAGVVHRDFKPGNVLVGPDQRPRVTDFGLAAGELGPAISGAKVSDVRLTQAGSLLGTPAYMSPEQLDGRPTDARTDQFSFCVALAEGLGGARPFAGDSIEALREAVKTKAPALDPIAPAALRPVLARGLSRDPEQRYPSMEALLTALEDAARPRLARRAAVIAAVALALCAVGFWAFNREEAPGPPRPVTLKLGEEQVLHVSDLKRVAVGDPAIVDLKVPSGDRLLLLGLKPGRTSVLVWMRSGRREVYEVTVLAAAAPPGSPPSTPP